MPLNTQNIYDRTRVILNDTVTLGGSLYKDDVLLPFVQMANDELSDELVSHGISLQKEVDMLIPVAANAKELLLPDDLIVPIALFERDQNDTNDYDFSPMDRRSFNPNDNQQTTLRFWDWRNQKINFIGATIPREVRLRYIRTLASIVDENSPLETTGSLNFLSYKTASLAAAGPGGNNVESDRLGGIALKHLWKLLNINVKNNQSTRGRRKGFRITGVRQSAIG